MDGPADGKDLGLPPPADRRRVVVLAGPSGSGKSRLANRLHAARGWPVGSLPSPPTDDPNDAELAAWQARPQAYFKSGSWSSAPEGSLD